MKRNLSIAATAIALAFAGNSHAEPYPLNVKTTHPHLYTDAAGFEGLKKQVVLLPLTTNANGEKVRVLPSAGSISFNFAPRLEAGDPELIFGDSSKPNSIWMRARPASDNGTIATFQLIVNGPTLKESSSTTFTASYGAAAVPVKFEWNITPGVLRLTRPDGTFKDLQLPAGTALGQQSILFEGRRHDSISDLIISDQSGKVLTQVIGPVKQDLLRAVRLASDFAALRRRQLANCEAGPNTKVCRTAYGDRGDMPSAAMAFALMYRLGATEYLETARFYAAKLIDTVPGAGGEWSATGRVFAMALLYDWLFHDLDVSTRESLVLAIKKNIVADGISEDPAKKVYSLMAGFCGQYQAMEATAVPFKCPGEVTFSGPTGTPWSVADEYIGGHPIGNVAAVAAAMLAIGAEHGETAEMLRTAYRHYDEGLWRAMRMIAVDGGHHQSWGYTASGAPVERLLAWRSSLQAPTDTKTPSVFANEPWSVKLVNQYLYGYRGKAMETVDGEFPASGDAFQAQSWIGAIGQIARSAAVLNKDGAAGRFYDNVVLAERARENNIETGVSTLLDHLYWPGELSTPTNPPLARYFGTAGRLIARDTWDFDKATLFEFKSTSFASINHHHLDQNSFTLFYKQPLLVDSGVYDAYGSHHWHNYYIRSIAHNTITVLDPNEQFKLPLYQLMSNDGGQWFADGKVATPSINQILPPSSGTPGPNYLAGVEAQDIRARFAYVSGNASRAYDSKKLNQTDGFVRNALYLQPKDQFSKPVVVVFDRVRPTQAVRPTFLLHTMTEPETGADQNLGNDGRVAIGFVGARRVLTVRNGEGAMTVETLLPANPAVVKVGGIGGVAKCYQYAQTGSEVESDDCRFTAPIARGGQLVWRNFAPDVTGTTRTSDMGAWRIEVENSAAPTAGASELFLHVFTVADNTGGTIDPVAAQRLPGDATTEAVLLRDGPGVPVSDKLIIAFNKTSTPATAMTWLASAGDINFIATGLKPSTKYYGSAVAQADGKVKVSLTTTPGSGTTYTSSANGVVASGSYN